MVLNTAWNQRSLPGFVDALVRSVTVPRAAFAVRFPYPGVPAQGAVPKNSILQEFIAGRKVVGYQGRKWGK